MVEKTIKELKKECALAGFYVDNRVVNGFKENNKDYIIEGDKPKEVNFLAENLMQVARGIAIFGNDARDGFLYQQTEIKKQIIFYPENDVILSGSSILLEKDKFYSISQNSKGYKVKELNEEMIEQLTEYCDETPDSKILQDKENTLNIFKFIQDKKEKEFSKKLKIESSLSSIKVPKYKI